MKQGWLDEETFNCFVPAQMMIVKGGEDGADKTGKRWIQGVASTDVKDLQGEVIVQNGIDFSYFLKHGFFNDDHKAGPEHKVGEPTEAKLTKNGLWVKGFLYKNNEKSTHYWDMIKDLEASGSKRKVGFSIQGKVLRRNGTTIEKCWIQDVAITTQPVNTTTWAELAKSLSTEKWDIKKEEKKEEEDTDKAVTAGSVPAKVESLEGQVKNTTVAKSLSFVEACSFVKSTTGLADDDSVKSIVEIAFGLFGKEK